MSKETLKLGKDALEYAIAHDIINWDDVQEKMTAHKRKEILNSHPYKIYQGKDRRWRTYVTDDRYPNHRRMVIKSRKSDLEDAVCEYYESEQTQESNANVTLATFFNEFIEYKKLRVAPTTVSSYVTAWNKYYRDSYIINIPLIELKKIEVDNWVHEMIYEHKMNSHTYTNFTCILNQSLDLAVEKGIIEHNVFTDVKVDRRRVLHPEVKKDDLTQVYTKEEQDELFELAWADFNKGKRRTHTLIPLAVMFMFLTGLRVSEVCALQYDDVHENCANINKFWRPRNNEIVLHTKGSFGSRDVILIPEAVNLIETARTTQEAYDCNSQYIFSMTNEPAYYDGVQRAFKKYCKQMGIVGKSSHKARKTYISTLIDNKININTIRKQVGHMNERTTLKNYCFDRGTPDEVYNKICAALS